MSSLGGTLILAGLASIVLNLIDYNLTILMWIDNWGNAVGWGIRVAIVALGVVIVALGAGQADEEPAE